MHKMLEGLELQHIAELDALREDFAARSRGTQSIPPSNRGTPPRRTSRPTSVPGSPERLPASGPIDAWAAAGDGPPPTPMGAAADVTATGRDGEQVPDWWLEDPLRSSEGSLAPPP